MAYEITMLEGWSNPPRRKRPLKERARAACKASKNKRKCVSNFMRQHKRRTGSSR